MRRRDLNLLFTCEHGGHRVPRSYQALFAGSQALLRSHRGWDAGALFVARGLARALGAPLVAATSTRLLVDLNRSPHNPAVFSAITRSLPGESRDRLLADHHRPHWDRVRAAIAANRKTTLHVAVHSFTPVLEGAKRAFTLGILYDPKRGSERALATRWQKRLIERLPKHAVRRNAPYRGNADGLTTALRNEYAESRYLGLELELNQFSIAEPRRRGTLVELLRSTLPMET